jgi:hypothetical protein
MGAALVTAAIAVMMVAGCDPDGPPRTRAGATSSGPASSLPSAPRATALPAPPPEPAPDIGPFRGATVTIPTWGARVTTCPTGRVTFTQAGQYLGRDRVVTLVSAVMSDVDGDGAGDYVAFLMCGEGPESPGWQVVAFRQSSGQLVPIGRVIGSQDGLAMMSGLEARPGGRIAVNVSNQYSDSGEQFVPHQWRTYAWLGAGFRQVEGPTSFPATQPAAALSVDPATLLLRPTAGGGLAGAMTVTVRNSGDAAVTNAVVTFILPTEVGPAGGAWDGCAMTSNGSTTSILIDCPLGRLDAHAAPAFIFEFVATGQPRVAGADQPGRYVPSNHYLSIDQRRPYTLEVEQDHEADILIITP